MSREPLLDLPAVYQRISDGAFDEALDLIHAAFDDALYARRFSEVDAILRAAELARLDSHTMIGLLAATNAAKQRLGARALLVDRIRDALLSAGRGAVEVDRMLNGLR